MTTSTCFFGEWRDADGVFASFEEEVDTAIDFLFAAYDAGGYEGSAFVLFKKDGKLYEVNGSHCSCYGLEGQWDPEETTVAALRHRLVHGRIVCVEYIDSLRYALDQLEEEK